MNRSSGFFFVIFLTAILNLSTALPAVTGANSLVVSSTTEIPLVKDSTNVEKGDAVQKIPQIYDMKVDSNVTNRFAKTSIISKVKNLDKAPQEATFSVVLPDTAYITGFVMEIGGKSYEAYVKEKGEAKKVYDQAVASGQAAAHVEAKARDSNRFTVSVNVEPESKATFKLNYEELLQRQNDKYELVINIHPGQPVKDLNVEIHINETRPLKFVRSPSLRSGNEISKSGDTNNDKLDPQSDVEIFNTTSATVKFNPDIERQKQFAQNLGTKEENGLSGQFIVEYDVERDPHGGEVLLKDGYFVHFFAPSNLQTLPKQVVFVLDTSGSMEFGKIRQLKEAMNSILEELKEEDVFSIVEFGSFVKVWNIEAVEVQYEKGEDPWSITYNSEEVPKKNETAQTLPPSYVANQGNKNKAKDVVQKLRAYGGTDIKAALETGLEIVKRHGANKDNKHQPIIIFLTDGEPTVGETNLERITSAISELNTGTVRSPIFSLSFGDGADKEFLQKISLKNLGFARHIYEAADASLQLQNFYSLISSPELNNVAFKYVSNVTRLTRTDIPIFFRGSEFVVAGEFDEAHEFSPPVVAGWGRHGPVQLVPHITHSEGPLERLWAYLTVKQILEDRDAADNKTQYTNKALDIALRYSFVTPVTSLVVVKPNDTKAVDTEDASKSAKGGFNPYRNIPKSGGPTSFASAGSGASSLSFLSAAVPAPRPVYFSSTPLSFPSASSGNFDNRYEIDSPETTTAPPDENDPYQDIKVDLPWLNNIISENGTIALPEGNFTLSINETISGTACPKTPGVPVAGKCVLLPNCPQVFRFLVDENAFKEHFCPIDKFVGICCPVAHEPIP